MDLLWVLEAPDHEPAHTRWVWRVPAEGWIESARWHDAPGCREVKTRRSGPRVEEVVEVSEIL
jgi:hypothetical protein